MSPVPETPNAPAVPVPSAYLDLPVVLLSHRGPVAFDRDPLTGERTATRGAGGLVTALAGLTGHLDDAVWVCVASGAADVEVAREAGGAPVHLALDPEPRIVADGEEAPERVLPLRMVEIPAEVHEPFYGVVSNPLLWFIQHRLHDLKSSPSIGREERNAFEHGYVTANELAADAVVEQVEKAGGRAVVLLHDYHFYLVGEHVRQRCPGRADQHFVHIPWPGPDAWQVLPPGQARALCCRPAGLRRRRLPHRAPTPAPSCCARQELLGLPVDLRAMTVPVRRAAPVLVRAYPISIDIARSRRRPHRRLDEHLLRDLDAQLAAASSSCGSTAPTRARTSCAASTPTTCCSRAPRAARQVQFPGAAAASRRTCRSTPPTSPRSAPQPPPSTPSTAPAPGSRSTCASPPTWRSPRRPTGAATCSSSTPSPTA
jgi:trehalose 6-phosphate synthase